MSRIRVVAQITLEGPAFFEGRNVSKEEAASAVLESLNDAYEEVIDGVTLDAVILSVEEVGDVHNQA